LFESNEQASLECDSSHRFPQESGLARAADASPLIKERNLGGCHMVLKGLPQPLKNLTEARVQTMRIEGARRCIKPVNASRLSSENAG
jgi:hypothetical protein